MMATSASKNGIQKPHKDQVSRLTPATGEYSWRALVTFALKFGFSSLINCSLSAQLSLWKILVAVVDQHTQTSETVRAFFHVHTHHSSSASYILAPNQLLSTFVTLSLSRASSSATQWKMWLLEVFSAICKLSVSVLSSSSFFVYYYIMYTFDFELASGSYWSLQYYIFITALWSLSLWFFTGFAAFCASQNSGDGKNQMNVDFKSIKCNALHWYYNCIIGNKT